MQAYVEIEDNWITFNNRLVHKISNEIDHVNHDWTCTCICSFRVKGCRFETDAIMRGLEHISWYKKLLGLIDAPETS